jgi:hypothetical protein
MINNVFSNDIRWHATIRQILEVFLKEITTRKVYRKERNWIRNKDTKEIIPQ